MTMEKKFTARKVMARKNGLNTMPTESCFAASTAIAGKGDFSSCLDQTKCSRQKYHSN